MSPAEGLAFETHSPRALQEVDFVINMSGYPKEQVFEDFAKVEDWPVEDPSARIPNLSANFRGNSD